MLHSYKFGELVYDIPCILTGLSCGINMIFTTIYQITDANCIQKYICDHISEEKNGECVNKYELCNKNRNKALERVNILIYKI